jgi:hypothetical protein
MPKDDAQAEIGTWLPSDLSRVSAPWQSAGGRKCHPPAKYLRLTASHSSTTRDDELLLSGSSGELWEGANPEVRRRGMLLALQDNIILAGQSSSVYRIFRSPDTACSKIVLA